MKTEIINTSNGDFLKIELVSFQQKESQFFVGKILAKDFLTLYTVRPAEYDIKKQSALADTFSEDNEYYSYLIKDEKRKTEEKDFQRQYDDTRVNKIKKFLEEEEYPFFPNTIIATCDLINDIEDFVIDWNSSLDDFLTIDDRPGNLSFLQLQDNVYTLYIPYTDNSILVIDGQHRLRGLGKASEEVKSTYELIVSFIIGYDRSVIAKLFYTINYEQKSVNKSLLYHLTGEFSTELDELTFMHNAVKLLNELKNSPFVGKVKMLGVNPKSVDQNERVKLTVSQAFLIDYLLKTISKSALNGSYQPIFLYYYKNDEMQIEIIRFLIKYFSAVRDIKKADWESPETNILTKGIGIASLIRVLHLFFVEIFINEWKFDSNRIKDISINEIKEKLAGLENVDFLKSGEFGGAASGGSINKLTQRIVESIDYFKASDFNSYFNNFKGNELLEFKGWLKENLK